MLSNRGWLRVLFAVLGALGLTVIAFATASNADDERALDEDASAIRLAQIYTEGAFYAVLVVGGVLSGYVLTRAGEGESPPNMPGPISRAPESPPSTGRREGDEPTEPPEPTEPYEE